MDAKLNDTMIDTCNGWETPSVTMVDAMIRPKVLLLCPNRSTHRFRFLSMGRVGCYGTILYMGNDVLG